MTMGRQHIRNGLLHVTQQKTGKALAIPIHPELQTILATVPATQMTFVMTLRGKPFDPHAFTRGSARPATGRAAERVHVPRPAQGRLSAARGGRTAPRMRSRRSADTRRLKEVERYTKAADQQRLAQAAMARSDGGGAEGSSARVSREIRDHRRLP